MPEQLVHFAYPVLVLIVSLFFIFRIRIGRDKKAAGVSYIYTGLLLIFLFTIFNLIQQFPDYYDWFLEGVYPVLVAVKFLVLALGLILLLIGTAYHFGDWNDRLELSESHLTKLRLLEQIQYDCRHPFQTIELLDHVLERLLDGLGEKSGAVYLYQGDRKEFDLVSSRGFTPEEKALLKHYPEAGNIISNALDNRLNLATGDFRSFGGTAQVALSKFGSMAVLPLISGKSRLGALLFFSEDSSRYDERFMELVKPIAGWLSERLEVLRLGRDFRRTLTMVDESERNIEHYMRKLGKITEAVRDTVGPSEYASVVRELVEVDEVLLLGLDNDNLQIYGGTTDRIEFSEKFTQALISALSKGRTVVLNQEEIASNGENRMSGSSLLLPIGRGDDAILLRRKSESMSFTEREMNSLKIAATLAGMIISHQSERETASARSKSFEVITETLRIVPPGRDIRAFLRGAVDQISGHLEPGTIAILYARENTLLKAVHSTIDMADISDLEIEFGESCTGRAAALKTAEFAFGATAVTASLGSFHAQNRIRFRNLFGSHGLPVFFGDYPILINGRTDYLLTFIEFNRGPLKGKERHQLYSIITGFMNLRAELISCPEVTETGPETEAGDKRRNDVPPLKPRKILVVADQPVILDLVSSMCQGLGFEAVTAVNPIEGLENFEKYLPAAVLVDMSAALAGENLETTDMAHQEFTIWEMLSRIRGTTRAVPLIALMGAARRISRERLLAAGIHGVLYKPFQISQLSEISKRAGIF